MEFGTDEIGLPESVQIQAAGKRNGLLRSVPHLSLNERDEIAREALPPSI